MSTLNFSHSQNKFDSSQRMEFFLDFPIYDSFSVDPKSQSPDRAKPVIDENTNYSSQLEEFPMSQLYHHNSLGDSKDDLVNPAHTIKSVYLSESLEKHRGVLTEQPINIERSGPVPLKQINRGVNEIKTETFHSPGRSLSSRFGQSDFEKNKENQVPILNLNKANLMVSDSEPTNRLTQYVPDTVRLSATHYYPQTADSPLLRKIIKERQMCNEDAPFSELCPSAESRFDINETMKLKDPLAGIQLNTMRFLIDELAAQEKEFQPILQIERDIQGKLPNRKYYMIFNYTSTMDEDEALTVINRVKLQVEDIVDKSRESQSQDSRRSVDRLKFYLLFGNSTGWLVIRQVYEINNNEKKTSLKTKKYNPANLFLDATFRHFENRLKRAILDIISGPENLEIQQLSDNANSFREKPVRFVTSWDSGIAVLALVFKTFLNLSNQELTRNFLLYLVLEKHIRTQKYLEVEAEGARESILSSGGESR